jgi:hypothetical protein
MTDLTDTQSKIETAIGATFPYRFGMDLLGKKVIIFYTDENNKKRVLSLYPSEVQRKVSDTSLDPHRRNMYRAAWEYYQSEKGK